MQTLTGFNNFISTGLNTDMVVHSNIPKGLNSIYTPAKMIMKILNYMAKCSTHIYAIISYSSYSMFSVLKSGPVYNIFSLLSSKEVSLVALWRSWTKWI